MSTRSRNATAGLLGGFFSSANVRRGKMEARMQYLADNRALQDTERAKSEYEEVKKASKMEQLQIAQMRAQGMLASDSLKFTDEYWKEKGFASSGFKNKAEYYGSGKADFFTQEARSGKDDSFSQTYADTKFADKTHQKNLDLIYMRQAEAGSQRAQPSSLGQMLTGGSPEEEEAKLQDSARGAALSPLTQASTGERTYNEVTENTFGAPTADPIKRTGAVAVNIQNSKGEDVDGTFWHHPTTNQITGPGIDGWMDAKDIQTLPQNRAPITTQYTDIKTNEEMKGDLIETFPGDPTAVLKRGGKTYVAMGTPVKLRGTQDQHGPKTLTAAQNNSLVRQDSSENVQSLVDQMLAQDYKGNAIGWVAARMSTISSMFTHAIPGLGGDAGDLETIVSYIKSNLADDVKASAALGVLDARAVAEGNVEAIETLLSYGTALWMNGGTRITTKVTEDAESISQAWITGSASHLGKLASLQNQTERTFSTEASRNLNYARTDPNSTMWGSYPTAKKKSDEGWSFATDKAEGFTLKADLDALKKNDPVSYKLSLDSLENTLASYDTLSRPIFWSKKYGTNVMLYYKTDPKTGAMKFRTFKVR